MDDTRPKITQTVYDQYGKPIEVDIKQFEQSVISVNSDGDGSSSKEQKLAVGPQVVYMARPLEPQRPHISSSVRAKHDDSSRDFPFLNLSEGEYVISAIKRHPIGLIAIWGVVLTVILLLVLGIFMTMGGSQDTASVMIESETVPSLAMLFLGLIVLMFLGGVIATIVYEGNRFFLTNESVTQHIQASLFSKKEQTISLGNIEDASFRQNGILQHLLNYGTLRLSTEGDETTYRFSFVENPWNQLSKLNNAVEAFKNGRPVDPDEN